MNEVRAGDFVPDDILSFYKTKLSLYKLLPPAVKVYLVLFVFAGITMIGVGTYLLVMKDSVLYVLPVLFFMVVMRFVLEFQIKNLLKSWGVPSLVDKRSELLKIYLMQKDLFTAGKVKFLLDITNKRAESKKFSGIVGSGLLIAFILPVWTSYVNWFFQVVDATKALVNLIAAVAILYLVALPYYMIIKDILNAESLMLNNVVAVLEKIYVELC